MTAKQFQDEIATAETLLERTERDTVAAKLRAGIFRAPSIERERTLHASEDTAVRDDSPLGSVPSVTWWTLRNDEGAIVARYHNASEAVAALEGFAYLGVIHSMTCEIQSW